MEHFYQHKQRVSYICNYEKTRRHSSLVPAFGGIVNKQTIIVHPPIDPELSPDFAPSVLQL